MAYPKLSVVIPTCDRADTLIHTLKTVVEQTYANLEIIISDNASIDNTKSVIVEFSDTRIRYINTAVRVGMSENWEFALSHVTGDFVMYLGDDDGLIPNACSDVAEIINNTNFEAIVWNKPSYLWPSIIESPASISMQCNYDLCEINSKMLLKAVVAGKTSYGKLPMLYSGFISMRLVKSVQSKTELFFHSITPDVYSGIVLADELTSYLFSYRPFSINGGSRHSNGIASVTDDTKAKKFFSESSIPINQTLPIIRGSLQSHIAEAILKAKSKNLLSGYRLHFNRIHHNIYSELILLPSNLKIQGLEILLTLKLSNKNYRLVKSALLSTTTDGSNLKTTQEIFFNNNANFNGTLKFCSSECQINNSYDASKFIGLILGLYKRPALIKKVNYFSLAILFIRRLLSSKFNRYYLPE